MKNQLIRGVLLVVLLTISVPLCAANLYVDPSGVCGAGLTPCFQHPQDAVNAAQPGDTILVFPGTYDSRFFQCPWAPNCSCSDNYSPTLIVYKDGLTIKSVDGPANTTIQATHSCWSNAIAVKNSTAGAISNVNGWSPNAIVIVANQVTIDGFTLRRPFTCANTNDCFWNTAGVFIGSKGAGYPDFLGHANGATVKNNVFKDVWHAVYMWHTKDNTITNNTVNALGNTGHWAAISTYDGWDNPSIALGNLSENILVAANNIADKGIALGAWAPTNWTSSAGSQVCQNTTTQVGVTYSHGPVVIGCNTGSFWETNTDKVLRVTGINYTGDTGEKGASGSLSVTLKAQVVYDGSADGSGIPVRFKVNATTYDTTTSAGGGAVETVSLTPGSYDLSASVTVCADCAFTATANLKITVRGAAQSVLDALIALRNSLGHKSGRADDDQDIRKLDEAIKHLSSSLDPHLWMDDGIHLRSHGGERVFNEMKDAVEKLHELMGEKKSHISDAVLLNFITQIAAIDRELAVIAIGDAVAAHLNPRMIAKANDELAHGDMNATLGRYENAIEHYRNAWNHVS